MQRKKSTQTQSVLLSAALFILRLAILVVVIIAILQVGERAYKLGYAIVADVAMEEEPGRDINVTLDGSMGVKDVAKLLERKGLIEDADIFQVQLKLNKYDSKLHLGSYVLNTSMTPKEMMQIMAGETDQSEEAEEE